MFSWLPLLLLAAMGGVAFSGIKVPFILDIDVHARFLGSLALLIAAELMVHQRIRKIVAQFLQSDIILPKDQPRFDGYINSAIKLRNSVVVELFLLILVFAGGHSFWQAFDAINGPTWYANLIHGKTVLTTAGYWYAYISLPIFQFMLLRWYFRIFIWYRLLWQISSMPLSLNSLHPDRAGGLSFLADSVSAFAPLVLAHTVLLAGMVTNHIWHSGEKLLDFKMEILGIICFLLALVFIPLFFFIPKMSLAKRFGTSKYTVMASHYVNYFSKKWLDGTARKRATVLGAEDIQSLADLSESFEATHNMRLIPFRIHNVLQILSLAALPFIPLMFTMLPLADTIRCMLAVLL